MPGSATTPVGSAPAAPSFRVDLPAGGHLYLQSADEVDFWEESAAKYHEEYTLAKQNDLITLGALLLQQVILYRCQTEINGMMPKVDEGGVPTGEYMRVDLDQRELEGIQKRMLEAAKEMRELEKQLGIDKKTREQGGTHTLDDYVKTLKRAAHTRGVHIAERTLEYERVINDLRVRLRLLYNADDEDRQYHNITPKSILDWLLGETDRLAEVDRKFNEQKGSVFAGKL